MYNRVILVGNLTRDVDLRYLNTGAAIATFGLASNRRYKKQDGSQGEDVCFVDITMFGRSAEVANQYLKKGSKILVEGRLQFDSWTDQQGNRRSKHSVLAESMIMLDTKSTQSDYAQDSSYPLNSTTGGTSYANQYQGDGAYLNQRMDSNQNNNYIDHNNRNNQRGNPPQIPEIDVDEEIPF